MKIICDTKNLVLREFLEIDAYEVYQMNADEELMKSINEKPYATEEEATFFIEKMMEHYAAHGFGLWGVHELRSGRFLGWCGLRATKYGPVINVRLKKKHWNKGYAKEAVNAVVEYAINELQLTKFAAKANANTPATLAILKKSKLTASEENPLVFKFISA